MSIVYWEPGKELNNGKYLVDRVLGSGGFGITYKITEVKTDRSFALKTLNVEAQSRSDFNQLQTKFINEAIALASCPHPNIVRVYPQVFQEEGLWCMVMEYVEGEDLSLYLEKNDKLEEKKAIAIINKVGKALVSIHEKGFLHRDIKPANILLRSTDSEPILIDFGLAREFISERSQSMTNSRTESFAPIEQYDRHGKFGAWTDVYALAATLYVLLTARPPLPAEYRAKTEYDLTPPQQYEPNISDRINEAILKGMELESGDRPQTVEAWLEMLKPPQPKPKPTPAIQPKYTEPATIPVPPRNETPQQKVIQPEQPSVKPPINQPKQKRKNGSSSPREQRKAIRENDNQGNRKVSRRKWLKYSGYGVGTVIVSLLGKSIWDSNQPIGMEFTETKISDNEYEFDVITVNNKGEEIKREQGQAKYFVEDLGDGITLEMVEIPGGTFMMGSPEEELKREKDESPQHEVTVSSFYMAKYEVTQAKWKQVAAMPEVDRELKPEPSYFKGEELPVEKVTWYDAVEFCKRLSKATGREYRLPSEAEWEYGCRAGTTTPFHYGEMIMTESPSFKSAP